jgi:hypothetical protein
MRECREEGARVRAELGAVREALAEQRRLLLSMMGGGEVDCVAELVSGDGRGSSKLV